MSEIKNEFDYVLKTPFPYALKGQQEEASFIRLQAPTSRHSQECMKLKQAFFRSLPKDSGTDDPSAEAEMPTGEDVMIMIAMSNDVDLSEVLDVGIRLFTSGIALVDGESKLTKHLIDSMSQGDVELMLGEYLVTFTLASSLARTRERSSKASLT